MTKTFAETLLFASVATNASLLLFFAGVFRQMMNAVDVATFKNLTALLVQYSSKSPYMIIVLNLPFIGAIPYYYFYGFGNWWITLGLGLWLISGSVSKMIKLPVYKAVATLNTDDIIQLEIMRHKINMGNVFQAVVYCVALVVMGWGNIR